MHSRPRERAVLVHQLSVDESQQGGIPSATAHYPFNQAKSQGQGHPFGLRHGVCGGVKFAKSNDVIRVIRDGTFIPDRQASDHQVINGTLSIEV